MEPSASNAKEGELNFQVKIKGIASLEVRDNNDNSLLFDSTCLSIVAIHIHKGLITSTFYSIQIKFNMQVQFKKKL